MQAVTATAAIPALKVHLGLTGDRLKDLVKTLHQELDRHQNDFPQFHVFMRNLEHVLLRSTEESSQYEPILEAFSSSEMTHFNNLYCLWETELEKRFVRNMDVGLHRHMVDYPLYARFERLIEREVRLLEGFVPQRVLFIGSGPMPITAFSLYQRLFVPIDCLERSEEAVQDSRTVISRLGFDGCINVGQGFGQEVDASDYDMILVALLAKPKKAILENILATCKDDARIVCRTSDGLRCFFYEPTCEESVPDGLRIVGKENAGIDDTISSYLLRKV